MGVSSAIYWRATGSASDVAENNPANYDVTMSSVQRYTTNEVSTITNSVSVSVS